MQGVVFNAHWLTYFDDSCTRFIESLGFDPKEAFFTGGTFDFMLAKAVLEWKGPAGFDQDVVISVRPDRIGTKSFDIRYSALVEGRPACEGLITYVCVEHRTNESQPIPDVLRVRLEGAREGERVGG